MPINFSFFKYISLELQNKSNKTQDSNCKFIIENISNLRHLSDITELSELNNSDHSMYFYSQSLLDPVSYDDVADLLSQ